MMPEENGWDPDEAGLEGGAWGPADFDPLSPSPDPDEAGLDAASGEQQAAPSRAEALEAPVDPDGEDIYIELDPDAVAPRGTLRCMVKVCFRDRPKIHEYDAGELQIHSKDRVVVETDQGIAVGTAATACLRVMSERPLPRVLRLLDQNDRRQETRNTALEREAFDFCRERIRSRKLQMKLVRVEILHGGNKAIFFFASETRVDFRELVKDLAQRFHVRIMMRQIGVRDEAKMVGGIGSCGCELCCVSWLPKFDPVSIRMAKDQNMVLNPQKVSGQCGRLKCCLVFELQQYQACRRDLPKPGRRVTTPDGEGKVQELDILRRRVRVAHADGTVKVYPAQELRPVGPPLPDTPSEQ